MENPDAGRVCFAKSIMKLLPPSAKIKEGSICVNGQDITVTGKGDAETAWKSFFHDLSGSYDIPESNYKMETDGKQW